MNKGYAIRNPDTGYESITCKGVPSWIVANDERAQRRRDHAGVAKLGYSDMVNMLSNNAFVFTIRQ